MVHEKQGIGRAGKGVGHVATDAKVTTTMHALNSRDGAKIDDGVERGDIGLAEKCGNSALRHRGACYTLVDIADQTMWFVCQVLGIVEKGRKDAHIHGAEIDYMTGKRAVCDAASASPGFQAQGNFRCRRKVNADDNVRAGDSFAIASEAIWGVLEKRGFFKICSIQSPVPIPSRRVSAQRQEVDMEKNMKNARLSAFIATLLYQSLFICPGEPPMPAKKLSLMNQSIYWDDGNISGRNKQVQCARISPLGMDVGYLH